jgi:hypothetical protein
MRCSHIAAVRHRAVRQRIGGQTQILGEKSGDETQFSFCGFANDPAQLSCDAIEHSALLLHPLGVVVDLAGDGGHDLLLVLARGVIETLCDPCIVKAEIARQGRRRSAQIVRCERLHPQQRVSIAVSAPKG